MPDQHKTRTVATLLKRLDKFDVRNDRTAGGELWDYAGNENTCAMCLVPGYKVALGVAYDDRSCYLAELLGFTQFEAYRVFWVAHSEIYVLDQAPTGIWRLKHMREITPQDVATVIRRVLADRKANRIRA